jgi:hypothetical protein
MLDASRLATNYWLEGDDQTSKNVVALKIQEELREYKEANTSATDQQIAKALDAYTSKLKWKKIEKKDVLSIKIYLDQVTEWLNKWMKEYEAKSLVKKEDITLTALTDIEKQKLSLIIQTGILNLETQGLIYDSAKYPDGPFSVNDWSQSGLINIRFNWKAWSKFPFGADELWWALYTKVLNNTSKAQGFASILNTIRKNNLPNYTPPADYTTYITAELPASLSALELTTTRTVSAEVKNASLVGLEGINFVNESQANSTKILLNKYVSTVSNMIKSRSYEPEKAWVYVEFDDKDGLMATFTDEYGSLVNLSKSKFDTVDVTLFDLFAKDEKNGLALQNYINALIKENLWVKQDKAIEDYNKTVDTTTVTFNGKTITKTEYDTIYSQATDEQKAVFDKLIWSNEQGVYEGMVLSEHEYKQLNLLMENEAKKLLSQISIKAEEYNPKYLRFQNDVYDTKNNLLEYGLVGSDLALLTKKDLDTISLGLTDRLANVDQREALLTMFKTKVQEYYTDKIKKEMHVKWEITLSWAITTELDNNGEPISLKDKDGKEITDIPWTILDISKKGKDTLATIKKILEDEEIENKSFRFWDLAIALSWPAMPFLIAWRLNGGKVWDIETEDLAKIRIHEEDFLQNIVNLETMLPFVTDPTEKASLEKTISELKISHNQIFWLDTKSGDASYNEVLYSSNEMYSEQQFQTVLENIELEFEGKTLEEKYSLLEKNYKMTQWMENYFTTPTYQNKMQILLTKMSKKIADEIIEKNTALEKTTEGTEVPYDYKNDTILLNVAKLLTDHQKYNIADWATDYDLWDTILQHFAMRKWGIVENFANTEAGKKLFEDPLVSEKFDKVKTRVLWFSDGLAAKLDTIDPASKLVFEQWFPVLTALNAGKAYSELTFEEKGQLSMLDAYVLKYWSPDWEDANAISDFANNFSDRMTALAPEVYERMFMGFKDNVSNATFWSFKDKEISWKALWLEWINMEAYDLIKTIEWFWFFDFSDKTSAEIEKWTKIVGVALPWIITALVPGLQGVSLMLVGALVGMSSVLLAQVVFAEAKSPEEFWADLAFAAAAWAIWGKVFGNMGKALQAATKIPGFAKLWINLSAWFGYGAITSAGDLAKDYIFLDKEEFSVDEWISTMGWEFCMMTFVTGIMCKPWGSKKLNASKKALANKSIDLYEQNTIVPVQKKLAAAQKAWNKAEVAKYTQELADLQNPITQARKNLATMDDSAVVSSKNSEVKKTTGALDEIFPELKITSDWKSPIQRTSAETALETLATTNPKINVKEVNTLPTDLSEIVAWKVYLSKNSSWNIDAIYVESIQTQGNTVKITGTKIMENGVNTAKVNLDKGSQVLLSWKTTAKFEAWNASTRAKASAEVETTTLSSGQINTNMNELMTWKIKTFEKYTWKTTNGETISFENRKVTITKKDWTKTEFVVDDKWIIVRNEWTDLSNPKSYKTKIVNQKDMITEVSDLSKWWVKSSTQKDVNSNKITSVEDATNPARLLSERVSAPSKETYSLTKADVQNTANSLSVNRFNNWKNGINDWVPTEIELLSGKTVKIDRSKYSDIYDQYDQLIKTKPAWYEKTLQDLDFKLAERVTLDNKVSLKYTNKEIFEQSFKKLQDIPEYKWKIISRDMWDGTYEVAIANGVKETLYVKAPIEKIQALVGTDTKVHYINKNWDVVRGTVQKTFVNSEGVQTVQIKTLTKNWYEIVKKPLVWRNVDDIFIPAAEKAWLPWTQESQISSVAAVWKEVKVHFIPVNKPEDFTKENFELIQENVEILFQQLGVLNKYITGNSSFDENVLNNLDATNKALLDQALDAYTSLFLFSPEIIKDKINPLMVYGLSSWTGNESQNLALAQARMDWWFDGMAAKMKEKFLTLLSSTNTDDAVQKYRLWQNLWWIGPVPSDQTVLSSFLDLKLADGSVLKKREPDDDTNLDGFGKTYHLNTNPFTWATITDPLELQGVAYQYQTSKD